MTDEEFFDHALIQIYSAMIIAGRQKTPTSPPVEFQAGRAATQLLITRIDAHESDIKDEDQWHYFL